MNTELSEVSKIIREFRTSRNLVQTAFAQATGISAGSVGFLENLSVTHGNIITPTMYNKLLSVGLDLKAALPTIEIIKRGKNASIRNSNFNINIKTKDPFALLHTARDLVKEANNLINSKINAISLEVTNKQKAIVELEALKADIIKTKTECFDKIIEEAQF